MEQIKQQSIFETNERVKAIIAFGEDYTDPDAYSKMMSLTRLLSKREKVALMNDLNVSHDIEQYCHITLTEEDPAILLKALAYSQNEVRIHKETMKLKDKDNQVTLNFINGYTQEELEEKS